MSDMSDLLTKDGDEVRIRRMGNAFRVTVDPRDGEWSGHVAEMDLDAAIAAAVEARKPWPRYVTSPLWQDGCAYMRFDNPSECIAVSKTGEESRPGWGWNDPYLQRVVKIDWREITAAEAAALVKPRRWTAESDNGTKTDLTSESNAIGYCKTLPEYDWTITDPDGVEIRLFRGGREWQPAGGTT